MTVASTIPDPAAPPDAPPETPPEASAEASARDAGSALYLACLGRLADLHAFGHAGLENDQHALAISVGPLGAVVVPMPAAYLAGADAEQRLSDVAWLTPRALRHEEIVRAAGALGPILPLPFGTLFSGADALRAALASKQGAVLRFLEAIEGHDEYGVTVLVDRAAATEARLTQMRSERAAELAPTPGMRYFQERRWREEAADGVDRAMTDAAESVADALEPLTAASVDRRAGAVRPDGREPTAAFAFLVKRERVEDFRAAAQRLAETHAPGGVTLEVSGPWPAYSFAPRLG